MFKYCILLCLVATVFADDVKVLRQEAEVNPDSFHYAFELDNSIKAEQEGHFEGPENWAVNGDSSYQSPEGEQISISYTADENGYQVQSANPPLPTPHPIPEAILRALEYIASHPPAEEE